MTASMIRWPAGRPPGWAPTGPSAPRSAASRSGSRPACPGTSLSRWIRRGEPGPLGEQARPAGRRRVDPAAQPLERGRVGPGHLDVGLPLLVVRAVGASDLPEAVPLVEPPGPLVGLEHPEPEPVRAHALREVEEHRADPLPGQRRGRRRGSAPSRPRAAAARRVRRPARPATPPHAPARRARRSNLGGRHPAAHVLGRVDRPRDGRVGGLAGLEEQGGERVGVLDGRRPHDQVVAGLLRRHRAGRPGRRRGPRGTARRTRRTRCSPGARSRAAPRAATGGSGPPARPA